MVHTAIHRRMAVAMPGHQSYEHRTRSEKLGVKAGQTVLLVGITDAHFIEELQATGARFTRGGTRDVVFCAVETRAALRKLPDLARRIKRDGAVWTIRPKGSPFISESDVMKAGKAAGLVDVKVVR